MKLRNKKTGEIVDAWSFYDGDKSISLKYFTDDGQVNLEYYSLSELNDEWEDYKPKEPLIKDEKIRQAIKTWVEVTHINGKMIKASVTPKRISFIGWIDGTIGGFSIDFLSSDGLGIFRDGEHYTVDELCGEEEKCSEY